MSRPPKHSRTRQLQLLRNEQLGAVRKHHGLRSEARGVLTVFEIPGGAMLVPVLVAIASAVPLLCAAWLYTMADAEPALC